ncbi:RES domain-containing protein [Mesorhizobium sp. LNHC252B00]|uniref:RES family NAD+ phosphorylase n=1 Tax=Mesorhizobium sp. LNHC252B00 TaxID=1287252 RepID=UPI001FD9B091|nr:RES domain-containing protein [Mesorhizobium sp. LNHC252B00]
MKVTRVGPDEIFHRYLTPKWAFLPTSGAGAAIDGGRFNRPGVEALYLSRAPQTALEEYKQGASITPPATLAAYKITLSEVADLSHRFDPNVWDSAWREWDYAWRQIARRMNPAKGYVAGRCADLHRSDPGDNGSATLTLAVIGHQRTFICRSLVVSTMSARQPRRGSSGCPSFNSCASQPRSKRCASSPS